MEFEKALVLALEAAKCLGGEQQAAIELVCRAATRGARRPSQEITAVQRPSQTLRAVSPPTEPGPSASDHFRAARKVLDDESDDELK